MRVCGSLDPTQSMGGLGVDCSWTEVGHSEGQAGGWRVAMGMKRGWVTMSESFGAQE